ncbi:MAG: N-acyl homoserine lactonase family protein [Pseudomonadota bacterium]
MLRQYLQRHALGATALLGLLSLLTACTARVAAPLADLRLYVFDCGTIELENVGAFGLSNAQTPVRKLFVPCYLIDHPEGRLLFDLGLPENVVGAGAVEYSPGSFMRYRRSLLDQLADLRLRPRDIDLLAYSHSHFDHVGSANRFAGAELLIQRSEYEAAFQAAADYEVFVPELYSALKDARRQLLNGDHDVFGDGRVRLIAAPGHTPGHQVLWIDLRNYGPLVLSGDLYHFEASRQLRTVPVFNTDPAATRASMAKVEALLEETGATLWIEHNQALADELQKAPAFYD